MDKALSGIRIIDMTHNQAGPACTQILGFLGADVIKLEEPKGGDIARVNMRATTINVELLSGSAKFFHVVFEKPIDLAVHDQIGAPEIQELLPLGVAIAYHPGVRPAVEGMGPINHSCPALVTLGEQQHVAIAADPGVRALCPNWFSAERDLSTRRDHLRAFGQ